MKVAGKKSKQTVSTGVIVFSIAVLFISLGLYLSGYVSLDRGRNFSGVLFENGEIYFGELTHFPRLTLTNAHTIQIAVDPDDPTQQTYQLVPMRESLWAPEKIYLNYDNIVFIGDVGEGSQIMQRLNQQN